MSAPHYLGNMEGVALITGAASGIGSCCARAFAQLGTKLVLLDLNMAGLKKLEEELALPPGHVLLKAMDVRDSKGIADFIATIPGAMGGLHFCINCSGILGADYNNDIANQAEENWTMVLDINLKAPAIITKEVVKIMLEQAPLPSQFEKSGRRPEGSCFRRGVIINMGSSASLRARSSAGSPYILSKHGLVGLTKSTAVSYGRKGIRCNILAPGFVNTPLIASIADKVKEIAEGIVPMGRPADPEEVADQVVYLCSERASYLNGVIMPIDGGWSCT